MGKHLSAIFASIIAIACALCLAGCLSDVSRDQDPSSSGTTATVVVDNGTTASTHLDENATYTDKDSVALYIHEFGHLPSNYISKTKARKAGWIADEGNLWDVLPGMSIGGSQYYNDDGKLPDEKKRRWTECDIDYKGGYRNSKRIVFSNDGLIFYTPDHYRTFERLY